MSETEDSGNTRLRKRDRLRLLFKKLGEVEETTEDRGRLGPAVVNSRSVVGPNDGPISSTPSLTQRFQGHNDSRSLSDAKADVDISLKSNSNSGPPPLASIPSNSSPATSPPPFAPTTEPGATEDFTSAQSHCALFAHARNFVVSGGNFFVSHP